MAGDLADPGLAGGSLEPLRCHACNWLHGHAAGSSSTTTDVEDSPSTDARAKASRACTGELDRDLRIQVCEVAAGADSDPDGRGVSSGSRLAFRRLPDLHQAHLAGPALRELVEEVPDLLVAGAIGGRRSSAGAR